jgi:hypothetical protein
MKRQWTGCLLLLSAIYSGAQTVPGKLTFALPEHPGSMSIDQGGWQVKELSAKANEREWGVRAEDGGLRLLAFLFVWPEKAPLTSERCRDEMLKSEGDRPLAADKGRTSFKTKSGADIAMVLLIPADGTSSSGRAFVASGDLCGDLLFSFPKPITSEMIPMAKVKGMLDTLAFDAVAKPGFREAFAYATVEYDHRQYAGAAVAYQAALKLVGTSDDPMTWRRVTTDQLSMALGIAGDLKGSRAVNEAAIAVDPSYPLYYYNLACADGEDGNATAAQSHLKQAFERRANTLPGEQLPDPASDDSFQKLMKDESFRRFVQSLNAKTKP